MKKFITLSIICVFFVSCNLGLKQTDNKVKGEVTLPLVQPILAEGVTLDSATPMPGILSEEEVMLRAADFVYKIGGLNSSFFVYEENPAMWTAKIEAPVLIFDPNGLPLAYRFTAVDYSDTMLMDATFSPYMEDTAPGDFFMARTVPNRQTTDEQSIHFITKREARQIIKDTFPDKNPSEPVALAQLNLENSRYSHRETFWYFTVPSREGGYDEYILAAYIMGWKLIEPILKIV